MWTRDELRTRLGDHAVIGMVHLRPLPGSPLYDGSIQRVIDSAAADAKALAAGGADAVLIENFGDRPFFKSSVPPETVAAMTLAISEIARVVSIPLGVNVLRNDGRSALAIAAAAGAAFIRVNILVGAMLADQGIIEGDAAALLRVRAALCPDVALFADHLVKHASPLTSGDPLQMARDLRLRGMADAVIVSGSETGKAVDVARLRMLRAAIDAPVVIGSGLNAENAAAYAPLADAAIVGTSIKRDGNVDAPVDPDRVRRVVEAFKG